MKRIVAIVTSIILLSACSNNGGESGVVNDGFNGAGDTNGGLSDTSQIYNPEIDTSRSEDRVDTEKRDSGDKR